MVEGDVKRRLAAILAADVAGYSRLMGDDERATITTLRQYREVFRERIESNGGRVVDMAGDSVLAVFDSASGAVQAATETQEALAERNKALSDKRHMVFRIGVNLGDIEEADDGTVYGDGVNVAARLEGLADPGGVMISEFAYQQVRRNSELTFADAGIHEVKNIADPVRAYRVGTGSDGVVSLTRRKPVRWKWAAAIVAACVVVVAGGVAWWITDGDNVPRTVTADSKPARPAIAVLPFTNMSDDASQEYFADGISEDLITELSRFEGLLVIARNSTFRYKGQAVDIGKVASELGVRYVLEGGVRRAGKRVRITAQLIDAESGGHLWSERYDRNVADVFAVQDEVTGQIIKALKSELGNVTTTRVNRQLTSSQDAYDLYLRGRVYNDRRTRESNARAEEMFRSAISLDNGFAAAYAELSQALWLASFYGWSEGEGVLDDAVTVARQAVALDPSLPQGYTHLATALAFQNKLDEAIVAARRAVALDANYATGYARLALVLSFTGAPDEALAAARKAIELDPYSFVALRQRGQAHFMSGRYEQAAADFRASLALNPDFGAGHSWLAATYGWLGDEQKARAEADELLRVAPRFADGLYRAPFRHADRMRVVDGLRKAGLDVPDPPLKD